MKVISTSSSPRPLRLSSPSLFSFSLSVTCAFLFICKRKSRTPHERKSRWFETPTLSGPLWQGSPSGSHATRASGTQAIKPITIWSIWAVGIGGLPSKEAMIVPSRPPTSTCYLAVGPYFPKINHHCYKFSYEDILHQSIKSVVLTFSRSQMFSTLIILYKNNNIFDTLLVSLDRSLNIFL